MFRIFSGKGSRVFLRIILFRLEWAFVWLCGLFGTAEMIISLTNQKTLLSAGYSYGYPLNPYLVLSPTREAAGGDRFWVQPVGDGSMGFITPVRVTVAQ
jgi:hypothetical protein